MLHVAIATRAFRRYSTYTAATLAGIFTNCVFGVILCFVYTAVWKQSPNAGGYDVTDAITYAWLGQAMIMTVMIWGGGSPADLAERSAAVTWPSTCTARWGCSAGTSPPTSAGRRTTWPPAASPDAGRGAPLRPELARRRGGLAGLRGQRPARGAGELRAALPGGLLGVLAPRRDGSFSGRADPG
jgi:hypothetical protein